MTFDPMGAVAAGHLAAMRDRQATPFNECIDAVNSLLAWRTEMVAWGNNICTVVDSLRDRVTELEGQLSALEKRVNRMAEAVGE